MTTRKQATYVTAAFVGGLILGMAAWSAQIRRNRRNLFSRSSVKRLAALGYLNGQPGVATARLLGEYVQWETQPALRRRGERMLRRMQSYLDQAGATCP